MRYIQCIAPYELSCSHTMHSEASAIRVSGLMSVLDFTVYRFLPVIWVDPHVYGIIVKTGIILSGNKCVPAVNLHFLVELFKSFVSGYCRVNVSKAALKITVVLQ